LEEDVSSSRVAKQVKSLTGFCLKMGLSRPLFVDFIISWYNTITEKT